MSLYGHMRCPENPFHACTSADCINGGCTRQRWFTHIVNAPRGCICPPTSEQTCQHPDCGRKPPRNPMGVTTA